MKGSFNYLMSVFYGIPQANYYNSLIKYIVAKIRKDYPDFPIIATGGPTEESIRKTIEAGANAITWTPPSVSELFKGVMNKYRDDINNVGHH